MAIAVTAGQLPALLPHTAVQGVIAGLFLAGSGTVTEVGANVTDLRPGDEGFGSCDSYIGRKGWPAGHARQTGT
jgi:NADPH:quinone reductase-like Zn-dependent oxidoreductase